MLFIGLVYLFYSSQITARRLHENSHHIGIQRPPLIDHHYSVRSLLLLQSTQSSIVWLFFLKVRISLFSYNKIKCLLNLLTLPIYCFSCKVYLRSPYTKLIYDVTSRFLFELYYMNSKHDFLLIFLKWRETSKFLIVIRCFLKRHGAPLNEGSYLCGKHPYLPYTQTQSTKAFAVIEYSAYSLQSLAFLYDPNGPTLLSIWDDSGAWIEKRSTFLLISLCLFFL